MRTRLKLLTVGLVLVTVAVAGCSSTAGSSGAVQDDASSAEAASSAGKAAPAPSPASSSAASTSPAPSCADGGVCVLGDTGPGGGVVFYVASTPWGTADPFSAPGTVCDDNCLYLEAALSNQGATAWCASGPGSASNFYVDAPGTVIGSGYLNTQAMLGTTNSPPTTICAGGAAQVASTPTGGLTDWYLPAEDELVALYQASSPNNIGVIFDGTGTKCFWGSTADSANYAMAYCLNVNTGRAAEYGKTQDAAGVVQVRAF